MKEANNQHVIVILTGGMCNKLSSKEQSQLSHQVDVKPGSY